MTEEELPSITVIKEEDLGGKKQLEITVTAKTVGEAFEYFKKINGYIDDDG